LHYHANQLQASLEYYFVLPQRLTILQEKLYTQKLLELGLTAPTFDHCATRLGRQYSADKIEKHWIIPSNTIPT
jgi:hypothetical protein